MAVDTHVHLQDFPHRFLDEISSQRHVFPVVVGYSVDSSRKAYEISSEYSFPYTVGIAPQEFIRKKEKVSSLRELLETLKPNALGEIGLDYKWATTPSQRTFQRERFEELLSLAQDLSLPVVIHCRDAYKDLVEVLSASSFSQPLIIHSFFGTLEDADSLISSFDALISINTVRTKEKKKVLLKYDLSHFVVETDSPYIARTPYDVRDALSYISEVKEVPFKEVERATSENAASFFSFDKEVADSYVIKPPNL